MSVITAERRPKAEIVQQPRGKARFWEREAPLAYIFMIPGLLILLLFMAYPFFLGIYLSMTNKMVGFADFSSLAWLMLFDSVLSPISWVLKSWGIIHTNINFLGDRWNAIGSVCVANIWRGLPFFAISILAGLQAVSPELHEAAALDGANAFQRFRAVTLPTIRTILLITTLFSIIFTFSDFQLIYVLTKGGPASSTHIFGTYAYQMMSFSALGQAAAVAVSMFPFLALFAAILLRYIRAED